MIVNYPNFGPNFLVLGMNINEESRANLGEVEVLTYLRVDDEADEMRGLRQDSIIPHRVKYKKFSR